MVSKYIFYTIDAVKIDQKTCFLHANLLFYVKCDTIINVLYPSIYSYSQDIPKWIKKDGIGLALILTLGFVQEFDRAEKANVDLYSLIQEEPMPTGHNGMDALLAGLIEWSCYNKKLLVPSWVNKDRFFAKPILHAFDTIGKTQYTIAHTPLAFFRHGVWIEKSSLQYI